MFGDWAWQFLPERDYNRPQKADPNYIRCEMVEMEWSEVLAIQLFATDGTNVRGGLPMYTTRPHLETDGITIDAAFAQKLADHVEATLQRQREEEMYDSGDSDTSYPSEMSEFEIQTMRDWGR